ncbi:MAG: hypothetical protein FJ108_06410 [Deltaproteobacteria bacterium]|nr:hypothetical protein [Deltaproteobacteria bacterium]
MTSSASDSPVSLSADQRRSLEKGIRAFPSLIRGRGTRYARDGRVGQIEFDGQVLFALVEGTETYECEWSFGGGRWLGSCSCPMTMDCKHLYALGLEALSGIEVEGAVERRARAAPAEPTPAEIVARVQSASEPWHAELALDALAHSVGSRLAYGELRNALRGCFEEADPELRCFRLAFEIERAGQLELPPALAPFLARRDLAERNARRSAERALEALDAWTAGSAPGFARRLRFELCLTSTWGGVRLGARVRLTSPKIHDELRAESALLGLLRQADSRRDVLADDERDLLRFVLDGGYLSERPQHYAAAPPDPRRLLERAAESPLFSIAADLDPALAQRTGLVPGGPVRLAPGAARIAPALESDAAAPRLALHCFFADGRCLRLDRVLVLPARTRDGVAARVAAVAADGGFARVETAPPIELVESALLAGGIELRAEVLPLVRRLAGRIPELARSLAPLVRHVPVTAQVIVDLVDEAALELRLVAHTGPPDWYRQGSFPAGAREFDARASGGWHEHPSDGDEKAGIGLEEPDPAAVAPARRFVDELLARFASATGARIPKDTIGWFVPVNGAVLAQLADAVAESRGEVTVLASPRVRRLLEPDAARRVRASLAPSGIDFFEIDVAWEDEAAALSDGERAQLLASTERFVRLRSGWVRRAAGEEQEALLAALAELGVEPGAGPRRVGALALAGASEGSLDLLQRLAVDPAAAEHARALRQRVARFAGVPRVKRPAGLRGKLRPYQRSGVDFLAYVSSLGMGALLADDMGLGKTLQALAWLLHLRELEPSAGPSLVVCPTSVAHNWLREAERFAPGLRVLALERGAERAARLGSLERCDLAITSYSLLRRDIEAWRGVPLHAAILDEGQFVKNPDSGVSRAVRELEARHRLVMTGTPLENRPLDLWSLMQFANPGYLGTRKSFVARFERDESAPRSRALLAARLRPVLLRRLKQEVAPELPARIEERRDCELSGEQRKRYALELARARAIAGARATSAQANARKRIAVLAALLRLRQICCHPALAGGGSAQRSGKLEALVELIEPLVAEGHKVLVFSQFVRFLELVRRELTLQGIRSHLLTGATVKREKVVAEFTDDPSPCAFLISLKAGGSGLNLASASYVVLLDPWWNPAVEAQAIDRTHRIGQTRTVVAYLVVARGTIEEKVLELQERKQAIVRDVLGDEAFARSLSRDDLEFLFAEV